MDYNSECAYWVSYVKDDLFSVRCIQDNATAAAKAETTAKAEAEAGTNRGTFTDSRDGKKYGTVKISTQTWLAENLNFNASGSKCYYDEVQNCEKYGRLYNWETAKKACPKGWHLPSKAEWEVLTAAVGGKETEGKYLKAVSGWDDDYEGSSGNGEDKFGFAALPGGEGSYSDGSFGLVGHRGIWWSASESNSYSAYYRFMDCYFEFADWFDTNKSNLHSVRCLQGNEIVQKSMGNKETQTETMKRPIQSDDRTSPAGQTKSNKARKKAGW